MKFDNIIVGAGLAGCTLARLLAEEKNEKVLIIEKRNHKINELFEKYWDLAKKDIYFVGSLAQYKYYNIVETTFSTFKEIENE